MKNKGFTLIEILSIIAIIAVVGTVVTVSFTKSLENTKEKKCAAFVKKIEDAACGYVSMYKKSDTVNCNRISGCTIELQLLIDEGFIDDEIEDACTESTINANNSVNISWVNGEKQCVYNGVKTYAK